jgi:hypothetical protein
MILKQIGFLSLFGIISMMFVPTVFAEPTVKINLEQTTYHYCEKLFYSIEVSEVTGDTAMIFIRDDAGKSSRGIPITISDKITPIPSANPFEKEIFPTGKYFIDVEYANAKYSAEFELLDNEKPCISGTVKTIMANWLSGNILDGFLMDGFERYVDKQVISIPYEINESNVYDIDIPDWFKNVGYWWLEEFISDETFVDSLNYLIKNNIIKNPGDSEF